MSRIDDEPGQGTVQLSGTLAQEVKRVLQEHKPELVSAAGRWCKTKEEAEDLVSDVCLYAISHPRKLLDHPNPRAWLLRVMGNRFIDYCRSPKPVDVEQGQLATMGKEDQRIARWLSYQALRMALQALPERLATVCRLRLEGLRLREIGEAMGVSTSEAGKLLTRALLQLKEFFTKETP